MRTSPYHRFSNVLFAYLRHRLKAAIAFTLVFFIFFLLFWLCGYDMGIYLYAIILSCTVVGIMLVYDLSRYWRRDRELQNLYRSIDVTLELMPKAVYPQAGARTGSGSPGRRNLRLLHHVGAPDQNAHLRHAAAAPVGAGRASRTSGCGNGAGAV